MDFAFSAEQTAVRDLARGMLEKEMTVARLRRLERGGVWHDAALWRTLADAGLLGVAVPEADGGMGLGLLEACVLLQEIGRSLAPGPVLSTLVGAVVLAEHPEAGSRRALLAGIAGGAATLALALVDARGADAAHPGTQAKRHGRGWVLDGEKRGVAAPDSAARLLVPARRGDETHVFLVDPRAPGVTVAARRVSSGEPVATVTLRAVRVDADDVLPGGRDTACRLRDAALAGICATQLGVSERAVEITARYVRARVQFGVPIGSFQAVQHRLADCYVDLAAMRWTTWRAAWTVAQRRPAACACAVAKFWAADGGARIAAATQHLHGGIGVDVDYPLHRYFLRAKTLELALGGATAQLARCGRALARGRPVETA